MPTDASKPIGPAHFDKVRRCFEAVAARLSDEQLLELADTYHALLRARRRSGKAA